MKMTKIWMQILLLSLISAPLPIEAGREEIEKFFDTEHEPEMNHVCAEMVAALVTTHNDVMNNEKAENYVQKMIAVVLKQRELRKRFLAIGRPFIILDNVLKKKVQGTIEKNGYLPKGDLEKYIRLNIGMDKNYSIAKICPYKKQDCNTTREGIDISKLEEMMSQTTDYDELEYMWKAWRDSTKPLKKGFKQYMQLADEAAIVNNFTGREHFMPLSDGSHILWKEIEPLYLEFHKYVRRKLKERYGNKLDVSDGLIPEHVLGNLWGDSWYSLEPLVRPFQNVDDAVLEQNLRKIFTVEDIFKETDEFYQSLGLASMKQVFTAPDRRFTKPENKEVVCYPSAHDYCNGTYRINMCARVNLENYIQIYHEMGHVQYFMQYANLSFHFRSDPAPYFHESIGETIALAATSPRHMERLKLYGPNFKHTYESSINHLMRMALIKLAFLPSALMVDMWTDSVTPPEVDEKDWNKIWWELREKIVRVKPPVPRSDTDFDPVSKYHIAVDGSFRTYFFAHIMQFQIYKHLCSVANEYEPNLNRVCPLHECNFFNSKQAGRILAESMGKGALQGATVLLEHLSGSPMLTTNAFLEYFDPLYQFLKSENAKADNEAAPVMKAVHHNTLMGVIVCTTIIAVCGVVYRRYKTRIRGLLGI